MMYEHLDQNRQGTMGLDEIAVGIHDCVSGTCGEFEIQYLERTYQILKSTGMIGQIKDMMNFLNFNRDYSCTPKAFLDVFRTNFRISDFELEDWRIKVLMQRYVVQLRADGKGEKKKLVGGKGASKASV